MDPEPPGPGEREYSTGTRSDPERCTSVATRKYDGAFASIVPMKRASISTLVPLGIAMCVALLAVSCGSAAERAADAIAAEWAAIENERTALDELRSELETARSAEPDSSARVAELTTRVGAATDRYLQQLVGFINQYARAKTPGGGSPPELEAAIQAKSGEDLLLAREHIEGAGDYAKAIDILAAAREIDPKNPELASAQAEAERLRFVDAESFGRIEKGMTEEEVRAELGQVRPQNRRPSADGTMAWFYPREGGAAAVVFFRPAPDGSLEVQDTHFEAVASAAERSASPDPPPD